MSWYWHRFASFYAGIGEAEFWLKHRRRLAEGLAGPVLEACCDGGRLLVEILNDGIDARGIDIAFEMNELAKAKLTQSGFAPQRVATADVKRLPFADDTFDTVIATGSIALFDLSDQRAAIKELARVARREVRLLESFEKKKGLYLGRILAFLFDGMRPIPRKVFQECGLDCNEEWDLFGGAFSYIHCLKRQVDKDEQAAR